MLNQDNCTKHNSIRKTEYPTSHQALPITQAHERHEARIKTLALIGTPWEQIEVTHTFFCLPENLASMVNDLMGDDVHEIRTNKAGTLQGAYWPHPSRCFVFVAPQDGDPMTFEKELQAQHPELISDWNRVEQVWQAKELILELYRVHGYEAARIAIMAATAQVDYGEVK